MMSRRIGVIAQKGGAGKTTLALHLAIAAQQERERVKLFDMDPQGSALAFAAARQQTQPEIIGITASRLRDALEAHPGLAIIDSAPHAAPDAATVARLVDLVLIPCRPSPLDLAAMGATCDLIQAQGTPALIVLSACPIRAPETAQMRMLLEDYGFPIAKTEIADRRAYARALSSGLAVTEFEKKGKAADEIRALWKEVKRYAKNAHA